MQSQRIKTNPELMQASKNSPSLKRTMKGPGVAELQEILRDFGEQLPISFSNYKPDGIFGNETEQAVRNFQSKNGLEVDGIAGEKTIAKIDQIIVSKPYLEKISQIQYTSSLMSDSSKPLRDRRTYHC